MEQVLLLIYFTGHVGFTFGTIHLLPLYPVAGAAV